jgi:hypothetical protein
MEGTETERAAGTGTEGTEGTESPQRNGETEANGEEGGSGTEGTEAAKTEDPLSATVGPRSGPTPGRVTARDK